jgi:hypothetical protein
MGNDHTPDANFNLEKTREREQLEYTIDKNGGGGQFDSEMRSKLMKSTSNSYASDDQIQRVENAQI